MHRGRQNHDAPEPRSLWRWDAMSFLQITLPCGIPAPEFPALAVSVRSGTLPCAPAPRRSLPLFPIKGRRGVGTWRLQTHFSAPAWISSHVQNNTVLFSEQSCHKRQFVRNSTVLWSTWVAPTTDLAQNPAGVFIPRWPGPSSENSGVTGWIIDPLLSARRYHDLPRRCP